MCRLLGFRSVIPSQVHRSLVAADNALGVQSDRHPDGWGVAYYVDGAPHVTRSPRTALGDQLFHRVSGVVASETVVAHVRKATQGELSVLNCHPFQHGKWVLAHNGDIPDFGAHRAALLAEVAPRLRRYILGDTDSEVVFFLFLSYLSQHGPLSSRLGLDAVVPALRETFRFVRDRQPESLLTLLVTDGVTMAAVQGGKELFWSSYKNQCADRDACPSLAPECEAPTRTGFVNHLLLSSEPLQGENVWIPLEPGDIVGVDWRMRLQRAHVERTFLEVFGDAS
ncbi:MAG: class II glutamine amidotransferase [Myxococcales bacterium]|nr:class II glutamine amidotransferase [Myxococcales bacterium]